MCGRSAVGAWWTELCAPCAHAGRACERESWAPRVAPVHWGVWALRVASVCGRATHSMCLRMSHVVLEPGPQSASSCTQVASKSACGTSATELGSQPPHAVHLPKPLGATISATPGEKASLSVHHMPDRQTAVPVAHGL